MIRKVFNLQEVPRAAEEIGIRNGYLIISRDVRLPNCDIHAQSVASLVDLRNAHKVVRQDRLHHLRNAIEHFTNVKNIGQGIEQLIQDPLSPKTNPAHDEAALEDSCLHSPYNSFLARGPASCRDTRLQKVNRRRRLAPETGLTIASIPRCIEPRT